MGRARPWVSGPPAPTCCPFIPGMRPFPHGLVIMVLGPLFLLRGLSLKEIENLSLQVLPKAFLFVNGSCPIRAMMESQGSKLPSIDVSRGGRNGPAQVAGGSANLAQCSVLLCTCPQGDPQLPVTEHRAGRAHCSVSRLPADLGFLWFQSSETSGQSRVRAPRATTGARSFRRVIWTGDLDGVSQPVLL